MNLMYKNGNFAAWHRLLTLLIFAFVQAFAGYASAQAPLSQSDRAETVEALNKVLSKNYIYPDKARLVTQHLEKQLKKGLFDGITLKPEYAARLSTELVDVTKDFHFVVGYDPDWVAEYWADKNPESRRARLAIEERESERSNHGFHDARILEGNIGYVKFSHFQNPDYADETAAAAMKFIENSDAMIFDMRYNRGGHVEMAQFIASYLFDPYKDQLLFDYYYYDEGTRIERGQWVLPALPGKRSPNAPVYILTSNTTFSAGEWFAYSLQKLGRATIVGAQTTGASHSVTRMPFTDDFFVQIPTGQTRDPVDMGDFEGVGVRPDHEIQSAGALTLAHKLALAELTKKHPNKAKEYDWFTTLVQSRATQITHSNTALERWSGKYGNREIFTEEGTLYYRWRDRFVVKLEPLTTELFSVEGVDDFRYRFIEKNGKITALERVYLTGKTDQHERSN